MARPKKETTTEKSSDMITMTKAQFEAKVAERVEEETMVLRGYIDEAKDIIDGYETLLNGYETLLNGYETLLNGYETLLNMALVMRRRDDRYAKWLEERYENGKRYDVNWR